MGLGWLGLGVGGLGFTAFRVKWGLIRASDFGMLEHGVQLHVRRLS